MATRELELPGKGYQPSSPPYRLRARRVDGQAAIAIHRPADAERATALIYIDDEASAALASFLGEES
jgi:hypothetical protein